MSFKHSAANSTICLFLATWVVAFSFCGLDAFMPAWLAVPHHAAQSSDLDIECEQACLTRSVADHDSIIGQQGTLPLQLELQVAVHTAAGIQSHVESFPDLPSTLTGYPASTKRYQRLSTYRL